MVAEVSTVELDAGFRGRSIRPGEAGYDEARAVFNGMVDKRPSLIVQPSGSTDVVDAVNYARRAGLPVAVRCGGHSVAGKSATDGGVLIDLRSLKGVHVDPVSRTAQCNAGVLWGEFDRETQVFGLATPGGRMTTTGVGGFTLGGGYGWLSPVHGLTCDNLISADVVTADGRVVTASEDVNPDLFWGIRGGGGNFGVVTSYRFQLHPVGPLVRAGLLIYSADEGEQVVRAWRDYVEQAPEELVTGLGMLLGPPEPFVPEHLHGKPVIGIFVLYVGDPDDGEDLVRPLTELGDLQANLVEPMPYAAFQAMIDPFAPAGMLNYWRGTHLTGLEDGTVDAFVRSGRQVPSPLTQLILFRHGGAVSRVPDEAMAASHREAAYMSHPLALWQDPDDTARHLQWVNECTEAMEPYLTGGIYLNFEPGDDETKVRAGYSADKFARLVEIKDAWDPENLFRENLNIRPSGTAA
ncbi:MAG: FAD-binding protein [Propionibacteriales bacterium]|nr:FAD-binding protein [Propionibacteriales bacterium]